MNLFNSSLHWKVSMALSKISYQHSFEKLQLLLTSKSDNPIESVSKAHVTELVSSTANERTDGRTDGPWREPTPTSALPLLNNSTQPQLTEQQQRAAASGRQLQLPLVTATMSERVSVAIGRRNNETRRRRVITTDGILAVKEDLSPPLPLVQLGCIMSRDLSSLKKSCLMFCR